jgi:hypothetical protein
LRDYRHLLIEWHIHHAVLYAVLPSAVATFHMKAMKTRRTKNKDAKADPALI